MNRCLDCVYCLRDKENYFCLNTDMAVADMDFTFNPVNGTWTDFNLPVEKIRNRSTENYVTCKGFREV